MKAHDFHNLRGRLSENAPLADMTWFKVGGAADLLFRPADVEDLETFLKQLSPEYPVLALGVGSNVIIRDGGYRGAVIRLGREFNFVKIDGDTLTAGAGTLDVNVALEAAEAGLQGLSFMAGIPGTIGGAVRMNAGAYGGETKDFLTEIDILFRCHAHEGGYPRPALGALSVEEPCLRRDDNVGWIRKIILRNQIDMTYRHTDLPEDAIILSATFSGLTKAYPKILAAEIKDIQDKRAASQPIREKTGGSTFANPSPEELMAAGLSPDMKSWQLIDAVGGRGFAIGGAQISEKHCNFLINTGAATASEVENVGEEMRRRVYSRFGIDLRWEIWRIGQPK